MRSRCSTGPRTTSYLPITSESDLIYLEWVTHNRDVVDKATGGKVGYIHLPDMGENGIREFIKYLLSADSQAGADCGRRGATVAGCLPDAHSSA